jgi:hypothetical protein
MLAGALGSRGAVSRNGGVIFWGDGEVGKTDELPGSEDRERQVHVVGECE